MCCSGTCDSGKCSSACSTAYCTTSADCCMGYTCIAATCVANCVANPVCDHDVCSPGGPLSPTCTATPDPCITAVCQVDPYCCCSGWDTLCIGEAASIPACLKGNCP
jgi:hypothetical protein